MVAFVAILIGRLVGPLVSWSVVWLVRRLDGPLVDIVICFVSQDYNNIYFLVFFWFLRILLF